MIIINVVSIILIRKADLVLGDTWKIDFYHRKCSHWFLVSTTCENFKLILINAIYVYVIYSLKRSR